MGVAAGSARERPEGCTLSPGFDCAWADAPSTARAVASQLICRAFTLSKLSSRQGPCKSKRFAGLDPQLSSKSFIIKSVKIPVIGGGFADETFVSTPAKSLFIGARGHEVWIVNKSQTSAVL